MAGKRLRDASGHELDTKEDKRMRSLPSLSTIIREAVKAQSVQNFCMALEPLLRRVVKEEVEHALFQGARALQRSPPMQIQVAESSSSFKLIFSKPLSLPIFTGSKIEDEDNNPLQILLIDTKNGKRPLNPLPSSMKVEIVVLDGDFPSENHHEDWTSEEFKNSIIRERTGKRPLLIGDVLVNLLRDGIASIGELAFTDNSSWIRSRNFRLGARIVMASKEEPSMIREAMTEPFVVKDHRGELYRKHHPPTLGDEVWRLEKIGKDGAFHKRLAAKGIKTVQDLLKLWVLDPHHLREMLGAGMSDRMWEVTISHARTCNIDDKIYLHRASNCTVLLNPICQVMGAVFDGLTYWPTQFNPMQKSYVEQLVLEAYRHWDRLEEVDGPYNTYSALLQNEPAQQVVMGSSRYLGHEESMRRECKNWEFNQVGGLVSNPQVEISCWMQTTTKIQQPTVQQGDAYDMSDLSSDTTLS
ncbi:protein SAR DEFICIENT 1 [Elaeis guineensis]|uniref:Protein SAR DEFICIENT 1 n=1 Tax=Elaeis guineensis var. tenera TaxID=51953 RepID=A0A6I9RIG6_ELAGV|nr:protein SAR DEFICIENT 1 [Elaeis guineensis]